MPSHNNQIKTDDLAFSAYLRMKGYRLIKSDKNKTKLTFTFDAGQDDGNQLRVKFINSEFIGFYNELRNLKRLSEHGRSFDMNRICQLRNYVMVSLMLMVFGSVGCQKESTLESSNIDQLATDAFAIADYSDFDANIQDATLEKDMTIDPVIGSNGGFVRNHSRFRGGPGGPRFGPHQCGHLGFILREVQVTEEQRDAIKEMIRSHHATVKEHFEALREANLDILEQAKADRQAILDAMKNGDITREEARAQLQALNESARQAIEENPENAPLLEAICSAKLELFENIRALLDQTQQAMWDEWVAGLEAPCFQ